MKTITLAQDLGSILSPFIIILRGRYRWLNTQRSAASYAAQGQTAEQGFMQSPSRLNRADVPGGRNVSGAPPGESAPSAPSMGTCSPPLSARASRPPWRRRTDAAGYHPAG